MFRHCTHTMTPAQVGNWASLFGMVSIALLLPYAHYKGLLESANLLTLSIITLGLLKGLGLWWVISILQKIMSHSFSSASYAPAVGLGTVAAINGMFLGESLAPLHWAAILCLSVAGALFLVKGHLSKTSNKQKLLVLVFLISFTFLGTVDQIVLSNTNWYIYLSLSTLGMIVASIIYILVTRKFTIAKVSSLNLILLFAGWVVPQVAIYMIMVTILPVSLALFAATMRLAINMIASAHFFKEGTISQQTGFAVVAIAACAVIFFY